ncbi:hypothetical protein K2X40_01360 [Candidatus Babeliales bacterium]|nr:hypothetical protein [Candidatus Babeliales bacterium]
MPDSTPISLAWQSITLRNEGSEIVYFFIDALDSDTVQCYYDDELGWLYSNELKPDQSVKLGWNESGMHGDSMSFDVDYAGQTFSYGLPRSSFVNHYSYEFSFLPETYILQIFCPTNDVLWSIQAIDNEMDQTEVLSDDE